MAWCFETARRSSTLVLSKDTCRQSAETRFHETTSRTSCARPLRDVAWPARKPLVLTFAERRTGLVNQGMTCPRMFQIQGLEWPLYLMSGFSAFPDDAMIEEGDRNFGVDTVKRGKTWQNWLNFSWKVSSQSWQTTYHVSWNDDLDNLKVQFWSSWSPWYPTQCAEGHDTRIQFWIHLTDPGGLVWFPSLILIIDGRSQGFWACEMEVVSLTTTSSHTFDHSYVDLWAFRWWYTTDTTDTTDTMGEMKRNDAPNNCSIFFNHFAWLLFEFLQRKDDCGTSWCFFVRSWRLSPKATSGSTFLAFLRSAACIVGVEYCTT